MRLTLLSVFAVLSPAVGFAQQAPITPSRIEPPNVVVIVADDFGVDLLGAYGEGAAPPCTPNLDQLAAQGMLFRNAWTNPLCAASRASLLTGRHAFRVGIGGPTGGAPGLGLDEFILPELLGYESAALGKWGIAGTLGPAHPNDSGFGHFAGGIQGGLGNDYYDWNKVIDGQTVGSTTYATVDTTDEAIESLLTMQGPWLLWVAYHAPHSPWQEPPPGLCPSIACPQTWCGNLPPNPTNRELAKAMVEAMDTEIGRLLLTLDAVDPDAWVFFLGDNGTAKQVSEPPFLGSHSKGSLYEGGVRVPLLVRGPGVKQAECAGLVAGVDLFATLGELARIPAATEDSVSMVPYFTDPMLALRETVYAERFEPNHATLPFANHSRAVRNARYKLIRVTGQPDELYDLEQDPFETNDLLPNPTPEEQAAYDALVAELVALGVD